MISEGALNYLASRTYRKNARREINILPLGGIYWDDEYPLVSTERPVSEADYGQILRMFMLRVALWEGEHFSEEQQQFWETVRAKAPTWALFYRLEISEEDRKAQEFGTQLADEFEAAITDGADEVAVTDEQGVRRFSATFDLTKEMPPESKDGPSGKPGIQ